VPKVIDRHPEGKRGADVHLAFDRNSAAVQLKDALGYRQAQT
jgi:hypothetical protein